jgi:hypothetical protein
MVHTEQKYILHVSTYQMIVLLLFNKSSSWTVQRMQDSTQIATELLLEVFHSLLRSKLLTCSEINKDEIEEELNESDIKLDYTIKINDSFER